MAENALDRDAVLQDIRVLTTAPSPQLDRVERTLADGYACALGIEGQRLRLQRELEGRAAGLSGGRATQVNEVAGLARASRRPMWSSPSSAPRWSSWPRWPAGCARRNLPAWEIPAA